MMIFDDGATELDRRLRLVEIGERPDWASRSDTWFAWHPVRLGALGTGRRVWGRRVWRNRCCGVTIYQVARLSGMPPLQRDGGRAMNDGYTNHDAPELCVDRLLRAGGIVPVPHKRKWPGYVIAFSAGWLSALALLVIVGSLGG